MDETQFRNVLHELLREKLQPYTVTKGENLLYKLMINPQGKIDPDPTTVTHPKRGQLAFQTDILVKKGNLPLVVIELKVRGFSTHDVLTYSTKAIKHKEVYPYLRYGLVIGEKTKIEKRFFTHNTGFDFAVAIDNIKNRIDELAEIIRTQLRASEEMLEILKNKKVRKFASRIDVA
jgi:hypothetical protein